MRRKTTIRFGVSVELCFVFVCLFIFLARCQTLPGAPPNPAPSSNACSSLTARGESLAHPTTTASVCQSKGGFPLKSGMVGFLTHNVRIFNGR